MRSRRIRSGLAAAVALAFAPAALALEWEMDDGAKVIVNTTISAGTSIRASDRDSKLLHPNNAALLGITGAVGGNTDDSDLNYSKGDAFSTLFKFVSDIEYRNGRFGGFMRVKGWYDYALEQKGVEHGHFNNGYTRGATLSDANFEDLAKFSGVALLDAYVYGGTKIAGEYDSKFKVGWHVLNWGESLFIQGLNQVNPIDVAALRKPGTEIKEVLLPIGMISANVGLAKGISVEGFYQWESKNSVVDGCGTYWLAVDASVGPGTEKACRGGFLQSFTAAQAASLGALLGRPIALGDQGGFQAGAYVPATQTVEARNSGQFGLSMRFPVESLDTEFGLYGMRIHSRAPYISGVQGNSPFPLTTALLGPTATQQQVFWEYPEDIKLYGLSAATSFPWASVSAELSYSPNFPVQHASGDLLAGLIYGSHPAALGLLGVPAALRPLLNTFRGPLTERLVATPAGAVFHAWDRLDKTQFQMSAIQAFPDVLGAQGLTLAGEVGMQWVDVPDSATGIRYGRSFVFGVGNHPAFGPVPALVGGCPLLNTPGQPGCVNEGFVSDFSWGYRLRGELTYENTFNLGFATKPSIFWAHDVKGIAADGQFNEGRQTLGLGLGFEYQKAYKLDLSYVTYSNSAKWDALRDRDYYSINASMTF